MNFVKISLDLSIFRDYDIRGIYPTQLNENVFYILGQAIATYLSVDEIAVGFDCRLSSKALFTALTAGIRDCGTNIVDLGQISTEMHYFASGKYGFAANIIISASHNPPEYNGLKIVTKGVVPLHGSFGLPQIKELAIKQKFPKVAVKGKLCKLDIMAPWITHVLNFIDVSKLQPLKVVVDTGNGMGGISWQKVLGKLPIKIIPLYFEPDGRFPHHLPDPIKEENLVDLKAKIKQQQADVGFAIDGDADRLFVVDETGKSLSGTITTAILAKALLSKYGSAPVLYNAVCGRIVPETIKSLSGTPVRVRVGHSFIKEYMKKYQALFAGEHSGHFYFRDNFAAESSLIAGLIMLEYLSGQNKPLSVIAAEYAKYAVSGEINFRIENKEKILKELSKQFTDAKSIDYLDGLSIWYPAWWFNLRSSKTEPFIRLNVEADNQQILQAKTKQLKMLIADFGGKHE